MNFALIIGLNSGAWDAAPYLLEDSALGLTVTLERERNRFEFTVSDLQAVISNLDDVPWNYFRAQGYGAFVEVTFLVDGQAKFAGHVHMKSVTLSANRETVSFTAFSKMRGLMDALRYVPVRLPVVQPLGNPGTTRNVLLGAMRWSLVVNSRAKSVSTANFYSDLDLGEFATRPINYPETKTDANLHGRFLDIDPRLRWSQMLLELSRYYNAVFYIDDETRLLTMRARTATDGTAVNIDGRIKDDAEVEVVLVEDPITYVRTFMQILMPAPVITSIDEFDVVSGSLEGIQDGTSRWKVVYYVDGDGGQTARYVSDELVYTSVGAEGSRYNATLTIQQGPPDVVGWRLVRFHDDLAELGWRSVWSEDGRGGVSHVDKIGEYLRSLGDEFTTFPVNTTNALMRYQESTGQWDNPVLEEDAAEGYGVTVFEARPQIQFTDPTNPEQLLTFQPADVFKLFGEEMTAAQFTGQYQDVFQSFRALSFKLKDLTGIKIGTPVYSYLHPVLSRYGQMRVTKVGLRPFAEEIIVTCYGRESA